ncbi:WD40-repeat-containing domain protein [Aspergillus pseudoustus]|uniref:ASTRA-associated protein 1 n=1 Tax=Aspergillus pseudoustus TaxID=1810923 RepID=A0ABR4IYE1_9EURO
MSASTLPPATPTYILRGHATPIHALQIFNKNLRLVSGDADGWIVVWDLIFKRSVAVWKAHEGAVLEVKGFTLGNGRLTEIFTHGRDHKLRVWRFRVQDEEILSKTLPVEAGEGTTNQTQPWLIHSLPVNALNFCAFSMLSLDTDKNTKSNTTPALETEETEDKGEIPPSTALIAVPNALDSGAIDLFHLPGERRICTIPTDPAVKTGMVMAVRLLTGGPSASSSGDLYAAAAYEDGHVMLFGCRGALAPEKIGLLSSGGTGPQDWNSNWKWEKLYASHPHSQPVLSIDVAPTAGGEYFLSSSADALLVRHPIPRFGGSASGPLARASETTPSKTVHTKHAGQQGLRIRDDGKVFATAGWDSRVRVYSARTMKELAVLKWHKEGCYCVAFAGVLLSSRGSTTDGPVADDGQQSRLPGGGGDEKRAVTRRDEKAYTLAQVQRQRSERVQNTHWLAAGSKDGKISLWDIY